MADDERLTRGEIQDAVGDLGWRLVLGEIRAEVRVTTIAEAARVASLAVAACGAAGQGHLRVDVRSGRAMLALHTEAAGRVTRDDVELAGKVSAALEGRGLRTTPGGADGRHPVQVVEIGIDALDIPAVRPFWQALTGYVDEPGPAAPQAALVDPLGQGPAIWFQQMDAPRPQRNRIHLDVSVPHEDAEARVAAAVAAGGRLLTAEHAPAFWVLADAEGNEACVTTWQGRD
jgi:4a-hydroxytetrahydrobiopterin dehydratase